MSIDPVVRTEGGMVRRMAREGVACVYLRVRVCGGGGGAAQAGAERYPDIRHGYGVHVAGLALPAGTEQ